MKRFSASRIGIISVVQLLMLLMTTYAFTADYNSGVSAKIITKSSVTGNLQKITYPKTNSAEVTAMSVDLAPGAETGWHKHPIPVYAYVISGNLSVELEDGKQLSFKEGEAIIEVVNTFHNGRNIGSEPVKLAVFYLGIEGTPIVIKPDPQWRGAPKPDKHSRK